MSLKANIIPKGFSNKSLQKQNKKPQQSYIATFVLSTVDFTNFQIHHVEKRLSIARKIILLYYQDIKSWGNNCNLIIFNIFNSNIDTKTTLQICIQTKLIQIYFWISAPLGTDELPSRPLGKLFHILAILIYGRTQQKRLIEASVSLDLLLQCLLLKDSRFAWATEFRIVPLENCTKVLNNFMKMRYQIFYFYKGRHIRVKNLSN